MKDTIRECKLYSIPELVEILGMERHSIYKLIDSGRLKAIKTKKTYRRRVFGKELLKYLEG
jgi:excisionase family DNA binding protein